MVSLCRMLVRPWAKTPMHGQQRWHEARPGFSMITWHITAYVNISRK